MWGGVTNNFVNPAEKAIEDKAARFKLAELGMAFLKSGAVLSSARSVSSAAISTAAAGRTSWCGDASQKIAEGLRPVPVLVLPMCWMRYGYEYKPFRYSYPYP